MTLTARQNPKFASALRACAAIACAALILAGCAVQSTGGGSSGGTPGGTSGGSGCPGRGAATDGWIASIIHPRLLTQRCFQLPLRTQTPRSSQCSSSSPLHTY